eukprot:TRINITY_DN6597_c0_g1_i14.p1 TRINITY_DN6597_c0_g1~~TRINITY_DN6597_c0_g1_i14.p1  ORF type:complete len:272 (-),score=77.03 TRINITY_DN6597_c0_g1_i14:104-802(-)
MMHLDYKITEEALSAMWGVKVTYAKAGEECVRLTPLNLHYEGVPLHDDIDGILPSFPVPHDKASPLSISLDLIDPRYDYDFTFIKDMDTFQRGTAVYKRPCGWKRLAMNVKGVYDGGYNGWLSMADKPVVWINSYMPTDVPKIKQFLKNDPSFKELQKSNFSFDVGVVSMPDIGTAEKFAQTITVNGKRYKFVIQNRVHPTGYYSLCHGEVFICPRECIRPYGFLIKSCTRT